MLETTTRSGVYVRTETAKRVTLTQVTLPDAVDGADDFHPALYTGWDAIECFGISASGAPDDELEALLHRATVRLVNAAHPGVEDFRVTRENAHIWAEGTVKA